MEWGRLIFTPFDDAAAAGVALAAQVAGALRVGIAAHGSASMAVPGGRTPVAFFRALREAPLDWSRVDVTLTDERWVPQSSPASNAALVCAELLQSGAAAARFHPLRDESPTAAAAAGPVWNSLRPLCRPFDAVVLGMGEDGHFASLFPGNAGLPGALDPQAAPACVAMQAPVDPRERLSLNMPALLQTRRLLLLATGKVKRKVLDEAGTAGPGHLPVAALVANAAPALEVYWAP